jgi:KipI family sensor histidine kinase inhibitor
MQIIPVGENWFSVSVCCESTADCARKIRALHSGLIRRRLSGIESYRVGLDCLCIQTDADFDLLEFQSFVQNFKQADLNETTTESLRIPVCCDSEYAPDLDHVSKFTSLSGEDIIERFCSSMYEVWMIGFMPGYPYMGSLDVALRIPRKTAPAMHVAAQSVAIADEFVGVYPFDSPGGWHVIGRTPLSIIDYSKDQPWLFDYGMTVQFYSITKEEFLDNNRW